MAGFQNWLPLVWPAKLNPRSDWNFVEIYRVIQNYGYRLLWEAATRCPCGKAGDNANVYDCPVCGGEGWEFHHAQEVRAAGVGLRKQWQPEERVGNWEPGTAMFTVRAEHCPANHDRITLLDSHIPVNELRVRKADRYERLRYPIVMKPVVTPTEVVELDVIHLRTSNGTGGAGPILEKGVHFDVEYDEAGNGVIDWHKGDVLGMAPVKGGLFAILYQSRPVFRVRDWPHAIRDTRTTLKFVPEVWVYEKTPDEGPALLPAQFMAQLEVVPQVA